MPTALRQRITDAELAFLDALASGADALDSFEREYSLLRHDLERACAEGSVDTDTAQYACIVSSRIAHISESFQQFDAVCTELTTRLMDDVDDILKNHSQHAADGPSQSVSGRRDVSLAAHWLSQNYYNPYPSNTVRDHISQQANWRRKDVDAWFIDARKRIGWNDIRKRFFGNKRAEAVQKASDFFKSKSLLLNPALESAFAQMVARVQEHFIEPFRSSHMVPVFEPIQDSRMDLGCRGNKKCAATKGSLRGSPIQCPSPVSRSPSPVRPSHKRRRYQDDDPEPQPQQSRREDSRFSAINTYPPSPTPSQCELLEPGLQSVDDVLTPHLQSRCSPLPVLLSNCKRRRLSRSEVDSHHHSPLPDHCPRRLQTATASISSSSTESLSSLSQSMEVSRSQFSALSGDNIDTPSSSIQLSPPVIAVLDVQTDQVHNAHSQGEIPNFSFDIPAAVTCDQPVDMQLLDFTFCNSPTLPSMPLFHDEVFLGESSVLTEPIDDSLSGLLSRPIDNDFLALVLDTSQTTVVTPAQTDALPDFSQIETGFDSFDLSQLSQPHDSFFVDLVGSIPLPLVPPVDFEKTKCMARLDSLRKQHRQLQARMQTLESQIDYLSQ